jgi:hypothetical protein
MNGNKGAKNLEIALDGDKLHTCVMAYCPSSCVNQQQCIVMMMKFTVCGEPGVSQKTNPLSSVFLQP